MFYLYKQNKYIFYSNALISAGINLENTSFFILDNKYSEYIFPFKNIHYFHRSSKLFNDIGFSNNKFSFYLSIAEYRQPIFKITYNNEYYICDKYLYNDFIKVMKNDKGLF